MERHICRINVHFGSCNQIRRIFQFNRDRNGCKSTHAQQQKTNRKKPNSMRLMAVCTCSYMVNVTGGFDLMRTKNYLLFAIAKKNPLATYTSLGWCFALYKDFFFMTEKQKSIRQQRTCLVNRNKFCTFLRT